MLGNRNTDEYTKAYETISKARKRAQTFLSLLEKPTKQMRIKTGEKIARDKNSVEQSVYQNPKKKKKNQEK